MGWIYEKGSLILIHAKPDYYLPANQIKQKINENNQGLSFLIPRRHFNLWFEYLYKSHWTVKSGPIIKSQFEGSALGLGIGIKLLSFISLNGQYRYTQLTKFIDSSGTVTTLPEKYKVQTLLFSIGIAFIGFK